jgi:putative ABC transport system permease protein
MLSNFPSLTPLFLAARNMRARRWRTLLTLMGIVLGVAVVLAIEITNESTLDSLRQVFDRATGTANLLVVPADESREPLEAALLGRVAAQEAVEVAAPSIQARTLLAGDAENWQIAIDINGLASGNLLQLYGIDPILDPQVRVYLISIGQMPLPGEYQVALPEKLARDKGLTLGDKLVLLTPSGSAELEITALLAEEGVALLNDGVVAFAPLDVVQEMFQRNGEIDEIALRISQSIAEDPSALEQQKQALAERVGRDGEVIYPGARGQLVSQMLATYQLGLTFFSLIAIFVGAFLIYNTFSMTVVERTQEIGMLRAIGMSRAKILRMVLAEAGLLAIVGSVVGIVLGISIAQGLIQLLGNVISQQGDRVSIAVQSLVQSASVGVLVTLGAALLPAMQAARVSPLEALRARGRTSEHIHPRVWLTGLFLLFIGWVITYRIDWPTRIVFPAGNVGIFAVLLGATLTVPLAVRWLERIARPLIIALYASEGALGSANIHRSIGRTTLTVAALMVALTMIIGIESVAFSFKQDMTAWIDSALGGDLYVRSPVVMRESFGRQLAQVDGVQAVTPTRILEVEAADDSLPADTEVSGSFYLNAIDPQSFQQVTRMEFASGQGDEARMWENFTRGEAVFISNVVADRYQLKKGDQLVLVTRRGEHPFLVAGVVMDFTGQGEIIYGSYSDLRRYFGEQGVDRFTLRVTPGFDVQSVAADIETQYKERRRISLQTTQAFKTSILDLMDQSFRLFDVLNLIGVIIGALGVVNTLVMNVIERRREIGGLRSLGMTRRQVLRMVLAEALALGGMGGVYGLAIGLMISQVLIRGVNLLVGYDLVFMFTLRPFLVGLVIALGVVQLAAIYPARRAARLSIVEAIKHE